MRYPILFPPRGSLRRLVALTGVAGVLVTGLTLSVILELGGRAQDGLGRATDTFVQEQAIADRINHAVMRQLLAVSAIQAGADTTVQAAFLAAGDMAYEQFRLYLSRDLTTEERLQLERVKEGQQRLEVNAIRATASYREGDRKAGGEAFDLMVSHGFDLLRAVAGFLDMREAGLQALRARQQHAVQTAYLVGLALAVVLLIGASTVGWLLQRRVAAPLYALTEAVDRLAAGDLEARVPAQHDTEFSTLAAKFNHMAENLRALRGDLERRNQELAGAVDGMHRTRAELLRSEKLSTLGRMTAGLVHELNNPLASILGYAELLEAELQGGRSVSLDQVRRDFVEPIAGEARRAHHLTRSLLVFSRRADTSVGPVPLKGALEVAIGLRSFQFQSAGLALDAQHAPDRHVIAEQQRLQETFLNIINNALHALRAGGGTGLRIHGEEEDGSILVRFDDDGPGFAQPELALEPFYTTKPPEEGTGLGLSLVSRYMDEFSGSVRVENRAGGGARVELRFRAAEAPAVVSRPGAVGQPLEAGRRAPSGAEPPAREPRVLVVEDEAHLRVIHERILKRIGVAARLAGSAAEARRILASESVDLIISDVKMPGEGGVDLYRWVVKDHPRLADRFLFVTGDTGSPETVELFEEHRDMFLRKPFEMAEYLERVKARLG